MREGKKLNGPVVAYQYKNRLRIIVNEVIDFDDSIPSIMIIVEYSKREDSMEDPIWVVEKNPAIYLLAKVLLSIHNLWPKWVPEESRVVLDNRDPEKR